jgi:predicted DNA-binding transcriptional regulator YafY
VDADMLVVLAVACRRPERIRFDYEDGSGRQSSRAVEPYRLVHTHRRWYLMAFDRDREAWRSFRIDRMRDVVASGVPFTHRADAPDPAAFVGEGVSVSAYEVQATIRFRCDAEHARRIVGPTTGVVEAESERTAIVRIGGDLDWIARYLAGVEVPFEVLEPDAVKRELRALGRRLVRDHR